jgi:hypothetical protein
MASAITKTIVARAFACRSASQIKGHETILKLMEVDAVIPFVVEALLAGTSNKKPKIPPECLKCIRTAYQRFGAHPMPNKEILASLKEHFEVHIIIVESQVSSCSIAY